MTDGDETFAATARRRSAEAAARRHGGCVAGKETEVAAVPREGAGFRVLRAMARWVVEEVAAAISEEQGLVKREGGWLERGDSRRCVLVPLKKKSLKKLVASLL